MKIKVKTSVNEYSNTHYYTTFEVDYTKPEVEDEFWARTGTRICEVFPVYPDLSTSNVYSPDPGTAFELWGAKVLIDEEDESQYDIRYIAVPVEIEPEPYYLPTAEYWDSAIGSGEPVCIDREEAERLYNEWHGLYGANNMDEVAFDDIWREATEAEIIEYGVAD